MKRILGILASIVVTCCVFNGTAFGDLQDGLVAHYEFEGNATDSKGNNDGTAKGNVSYVAGRIGQAASFDGDGDYIDLTEHTTQLGLPSGSLAMWFKIEGSGGQPLFDAEDLDGSPTDNHYVYLGDSMSAYGDESIVFRTNPLFMAFRKGHNYFYDQAWHHIVIAIDGLENRVYVDGNKQAVSFYRGSTTTDPDPDKNLIFLNPVGLNSISIGRYYLGSAYFKGLIDDVRIYNRALTAAEVKALYGGTSDYSIIATAGNGGAISPSGTISVSSGGSQTFMITAANEYQILDVRVDDVSQGAVGTYTFSNVTGDHTISASFYEGGTTGMPIGTILYRTSDSNEMPGRVGSPTGDDLNFPYLQIPCLIYCGLLYSEGWPAASEKTRILWENCPNEGKPYPPTRTGHVAVYIGQIDEEEKIIEAGGNYTDGGILLDIPEILIAPLSTFVDEENGQVFVGAKFPTGSDVHGRSLPDNCQTNIVGLAKEHKNEGYDLDFNHQKGETEGDWICVGFAEKLYESCNLEPKVIGERALTFFDPYPYGTNGNEVYGGYDITKDGFYNNEAAGGLTYFYSYAGEEGYFRSCDEVCAGTGSFEAFATFSNDTEFSQVRHPRNDENDTTCGNNYAVGRESNGNHYIFWPYTQFKQDTLKSIRTTLDVGTTVINVVGGPSRENPVTVYPGCGKTIEIEVEVLGRNGEKVSNLTANNFTVSLEKNEDGRCVAMASGYNKETNEVYFYSANIPYTKIGCGTYEIRVDYRDNNGNMRSSYSRDNALVVSNVGEEATVGNLSFLPGTTWEYIATKILTISGGIDIRKGATATFTAPKVKVLSGFNAEIGSSVNIKQGP